MATAVSKCWPKRSNRPTLEPALLRRMSYYRTPEHRAKQAERIRRWKPWEKSTGPKSEEGKRRSAMRGYKGGTRELLREVARLLREQAEALKRIV